MKLRTLAVFALVALPALSLAQDQRYAQKRATLAYQFDLDGTTANDAGNVAFADLADSTTYTIAAQPDACRQVKATIVDANSSITAGVLTVVYVDCLGYTVTWTRDFSVVANRGSASSTIGYAASITSVTTNALTGEEAATDQVKVGDAGAPAIGWTSYGVLLPVGPNGEHAVDPFSTYEVTSRITTSGASSTTITAVSSNGAFNSVAVGDMLIFTLAPNYTYRRKVTARASANSITVSQAISIPTAGVPFEYQRFFFSTNPADDLSVPVSGYKTARFIWEVAANANTGGVVTKLECTDKGAGWPTGTWVTQTQTVTTIASGATTVGADTLQSGLSESINLETHGYTNCRQGFRIATTDDGDGSPESINLSVKLIGPPLANQ